MDEETELTNTVTPDQTQSDQDDRPLCNYHDKLTKLMEVLSNDMRWLVRLSKGVIGLVCTIALLLIPFMWNQTVKLRELEQQIQTVSTRVEQYVLATNTKLDRLEARVSELELEFATFHGAAVAIGNGKRR